MGNGEWRVEWVYRNCGGCWCVLGSLSVHVKEREKEGEVQVGLGFTCTVWARLGCLRLLFEPSIVSSLSGTVQVPFRFLEFCVCDRSHALLPLLGCRNLEIIWSSGFVLYFFTYGLWLSSQARQRSMLSISLFLPLAPSLELSLFCVVTLHVLAVLFLLETEHSRFNHKADIFISIPPPFPSASPYMPILSW